MDKNKNDDITLLEDECFDSLLKESIHNERNKQLKLEDEKNNQLLQSKSNNELQSLRKDFLCSGYRSIKSISLGCLSTSLTTTTTTTTTTTATTTTTTNTNIQNITNYDNQNKENEILPDEIKSIVNDGASRSDDIDSSILSNAQISISSNQHQNIENKIQIEVEPQQLTGQSNNDDESDNSETFDNNASRENEEIAETITTVQPPLENLDNDANAQNINTNEVPLVVPVQSEVIILQETQLNENAPQPQPPSPIEGQPKDQDRNKYLSTICNIKPIIGAAYNKVAQVCSSFINQTEKLHSNGLYVNSTKDIPGHLLYDAYKKGLVKSTFKNLNGDTPINSLFIFDIKKYTLNQISNLFSGFKSKWIHFKNGNEETLLIALLKNSNGWNYCFYVVLLLLKSRIDFNALDKENKSASYYATVNNQVEVIDILYMLCQTTTTTKNQYIQKINQVKNLNHHRFNHFVEAFEKMELEKYTKLFILQDFKEYGSLYRINGNNGYYLSIFKDEITKINNYFNEPQIPINSFFKVQVDSIFNDPKLDLISKVHQIPPHLVTKYEYIFGRPVSPASNGCYRGINVALKPIKADLKAFKELASVILLGDHHSIIKFYGVVNLENTFYMVMELANKSLQYLLENNKINKWDQYFNIIIQTCESVKYCHRKGVAHRDVKPLNLLIFDNGRVVICDFGETRKTHETTDNNNNATFDDFRGTRQYAAPEMCQYRAIGEKSRVPKDKRTASDIFSIGVVAYELSLQLTTGKHIIPSIGFQKVYEGNRLSFPDSTPNELKEFIYYCWEHDYNTRPTIDQIQLKLFETKQAYLYDKEIWDIILLDQDKSFVPVFEFPPN